MNFDYDKCTKCGLCVKVCGSHAIDLDEKGFPHEDLPIICNDCGHCMAVCPTGAVLNTRLDKNQIREMIDPKITFDQFFNLVRNRRSIRIFKKEPITKEHMDKIMECVRYIPTGSNKQALKYLFITDPTILQEIKKKMAKGFALTSGLANSIGRLFVKKEDRQSLKRHMKRWKEGYDPFLRDAPCLLIIYTNLKYFGIPAWDAGIASYNINLACETLGIGVLMNGFHVVTSKILKSLKKISLIPKKHYIVASMCLGYPAIKYKNTVSRNPLKIQINKSEIQKSV